MVVKYFQNGLRSKSNGPKTNSKNIYWDTNAYTTMGCKLSVSVVHPESIVNKIKESMSPKCKREKTISPPEINIKTEIPRATNSSVDIPGTPDSLDIYKTISIDSCNDCI